MLNQSHEFKNKVVPVADFDSSINPTFTRHQAAPHSQPPYISQKRIISDIFGLISQDVQGDSTIEPEPSKHDTAVDFMRHVAREEIAQKTAAPCNLHQATCFFNLVHQKSSHKHKHVMLTVSFVLIWMQLISVMAFVYGVYNATCSRSSDCFVGQFCSPESELKQMMCHPCLQKWSPSCNKDGSLLENHSDMKRTLWEKSIWPEVPMTDDTSQKMCLACVVDMAFLSGRQATLSNLTKMSSADIFIFILCLALISLSVVNELRDIFLCDLSRLEDPVVNAAADQRKAAGLQPIPLAMLSLMPSACKTWKTHWILFSFSFIRRYAVLPVLIMSVPMLVVVQGSSGVSICLNSVGVLFVLEMDNLAYEYGIHEKNREIMEEEGTIHLNERVHESLIRMKNSHLISVPLGIVATLLLIRGDYTGPYHMQILWMVVCSLSFWLSGLLEIFMFSHNQDMRMRLTLFFFEVSKMVMGEMAIWCALCVLYPYFIPRFFSGAFW
jgi:hypothetical protein